jgi:hypothetical protein
VNLLSPQDPYKITKHVRVNGVDYDIPRGYFRVFVPKYEQAIEIYLITMRPNLTILPKSERELFEEKKADEIVAILASDPTRINNPTRDPKKGPDFDRAVEQDKKLTHHTELVGYEFGLEVYGLPPSRKNQTWGGIPYVRRENGKVTTAIRCGEKEYALCQHFFYDGYLTYDISYAKSRLKDWKETQNKVVDLFKGFRDRAKGKQLDKIVIPESLVDPMYYDTHSTKMNNIQPGR